MIEKTGDRTVVAPDRKPSFVDQSLIAEIDRATWTWAKTYAEFAPHWYIVKDKHPGLFWRLSRAIDAEGEVHQFRNTKTFNRYLIIGDYKYWHYQIILNRAKKEWN